MPLLFALSVALSIQDLSDPWNLEIGPAGKVAIAPGLTNLSTGKPSSIPELARSLEGSSYVIFGESHDNRNHKEFCSELVEELVKQGRNVTVGFEMFTRPNQRNLAPWSMGYWTEDEFIEKSNWKTEWGFDYNIYKPLFDVIKQNKIPMVALNVPRDWVRAVGRGGPDALPAEARNQVPAIDISNQDHDQFFLAMMGGHPPASGTSNIRSAQVLWDIGMADSAKKWMDRQPSTPNRIMLILAGSGHAGYHLGINYWLQKWTGHPVPTIIGFDQSTAQVSRGVGDWAYVTEKNETGS